MKKQISYLILSMLTAAAGAQPCYEKFGLVCPKGQIDQCSLWNKASDEHKCVAPSFDDGRAEDFCVDKSRRQIVIIENLAYTGASENGSTPISATMTAITIGENGNNSIRKAVLTGTEANSNKGAVINLESPNGDTYLSNVYTTEATLANQKAILCD